MDAHADFAGRRRAGIGKVHAYEIFQSGGLAQGNGFHRGNS
jgi:hypothetical protein